MARMARRYDICPHCKTPTGTEELYCNACGEAVTYEDLESDLRDIRTKALKKDLTYVFNAILATVLLVCFGLVLLYFWGGKAKAATTIVLNVSAALEAEETSLTIKDARLELPHWPANGPLVVSFRYALSPPNVQIVLTLKAKDSNLSLQRMQLPARFITGLAVFRIPLAQLDHTPPFNLVLSQGKKTIAKYDVTAADLRELR